MVVFLSNFSNFKKFLIKDIYYSIFRFLITVIKEEIST